MQKRMQHSESTKEPGKFQFRNTNSSGTEFTYKVRKQSAYGGYKTITKKTKKPLSREQLLNMRVKNKSDRYCMWNSC